MDTITSDNFVLLIEDNADHAELVRRAFSRARDELGLVSVASLGAARAVLDSSAPALVLCDYLLPDGNGLEILRGYAGRRGSSAPFILLTSHGDESVAVEAMKAGATDYLTKSEATLLALPDVCRATIREYREKRQRMRAEEHLLETQQQSALLADLLEHSSQPLAIALPDGRLSGCNEALQALLGYRRPDLLALNWWGGITAPSCRQAEGEALAALRRTRVPVRYQGEFLRCDGSAVDVEIFAHLKSDPAGAPVCYFAFITDITERRRAELSLRSSEERFRLAVLNSPIPTMIHAEDGEVLLISNSWTEETGYRHCDIPTTGEWTARAFGERGAAARGEMEKLYRLAGRSNDGEMVITTSRGEGRVWDFSSGPLGLLPDGRRLAISMAKDITQRKRLEEQLLQSQKMESIGRLAGGVAHDFNNMLSVILGYAELSKLGLPPGSPLLANLNEVVKAANRSRDITRQLLAFSRKELISPRVVRLNELILETEKTLNRLIGEEIRLSFHPGAGLWNVRIDPTQVDQILVNLAVNARDAMPRGGNLTVSTANLAQASPFFLQHQQVPAGEYVSIVVRDDGQGMDRQTLECIFEPFFTTKELGRGTGLGLATVYGIIAQNNGFIGASSEPGQGSEFTVLLPRLRQEAAAPELPPPGAPRGCGVVLLVEDDDSVRRMTSQMLETAGYAVIPALSPQQAISICSRPDPRIDLILTDVVMPVMSGKEMADGIAALRPGIQVVFMSGYTSDIIAQRGVLEQGMHFIQKPFDMGALSRKLASVLAGRPPAPHGAPPPPGSS